MAKNIVMLAMGMDIGGAETHIVELSCALRRKGHRVTVFSSGGDYTKKLSEMGVDHITAPMNTKRPGSMIRSYKILYDFCRRERVSIIHSHTRITNFIAHFVSKKLHLPMVTTVHGRFSLGPLQRLFSRWGDRQLAVSEDLREYVADGYNIPREKVRLTVNGINPDSFFEQNDPSLRGQFGYTADHQVIICVTRIDPDASESALRLLQAAPLIYAARPNTRILIVGGGKQFDMLQQKANEINAETEPNFVCMAGPQTNIPAFLNLGDVFVGVSRAALEAMACGMPAVLMGNAGYLGVFSKDNTKACIDTNFTCRGYEHVSSDVVANTLLDILAHPEQYKENICYGQELVKEHYSVHSMVEDALATYEDAQNDLRPNDLMISGYYGTHNFGDDITMKAIIENVSKQYPVKTITILNHYTKDLIPDPRVQTVHRFNLFKILPLMRKTKLFMLGGGSLLQDVTSNRSLFYYLFMLFHAVKFGCKTMIYANGIGPVLVPRHQKQVNKVLSRLDRITIRDSISYKDLLKNGFSKETVLLTADEAFCYNYNVESRLPAEFPATDKKILLVNLRPYARYPGDISGDVAEALDRVATEYDLYPVLLPVQFDQDEPILQKVSRQMNVPHHIFSKRLTEDEIIACIRRCDYLLTERLHPMVFAARMKKPVAGVVYDPKVAATADSLSISEYTVNLQDISTESIYQIVCRIIQNASEISQSLGPAADKMYQAAQQNSAIAGELLGE